MNPVHPRLSTLLEFWLASSEAEHPPDWNDTDRILLKPWMGNLNVVEAVDDGRDFFCRLHGTRLAAIAGNDATGTLYSSLPDVHGDLLFQEYNEVYRTRRPKLTSRSPLSQRKNYIELEKLMLPYRNGGTECGIILTGIYVLGPRIPSSLQDKVQWGEALH